MPAYYAVTTAGFQQMKNFCTERSRLCAMKKAFAGLQTVIFQNCTMFLREAFSGGFPTWRRLVISRRIFVIK